MEKGLNLDNEKIKLKPKSNKPSSVNYWSFIYEKEKLWYDRISLIYE